MTVTAEYNEAFCLSDEMDVPHGGDAGVSTIKNTEYSNEYEATKSVNTYEQSSKVDRCSELLDAVSQIDTTNSHCIVEIKEALSRQQSRNTYSTYPNDCNTCECSDDIGYSNSSYMMNDEDENEGLEKSSSHCAVDIETISTNSMAKIFYNYDINKLSTNNTKLTSPVPEGDSSCCDCGTSGSVYEKTSLENGAPFTIVKDDVGCCEQGVDSLDHQIDVNNYGSSSLIRSLTEHSLKSCKEDDLPTYRSLIAFRLQDCPPNYESVTGIRVNVDEVRSFRFICNFNQLNERIV